MDVQRTSSTSIPMSTPHKPINLFDIVAHEGVEGMVRFYAINSRIALGSVHRMQVKLSAEEKYGVTQSLPNKYGAHVDDDGHLAGTPLSQAKEEIDNILQNISMRLQLKAYAHEDDIFTTDTDADMMGGSRDGQSMAISHRVRSIFDFRLGCAKRNPAPSAATAVPLVPSLTNIPIRRTTQREETPSHSSSNSDIHSTFFHINAISKEQVECCLYERARALTSSRPNASFVVHHRKNENDLEEIPVGANHDRNNDSTALFDGAVANSTPIGGGSDNYSRGGGTGTILHLACALDEPLSLALLLVMGADASSRHTTFKRLMIHEAACSNSPKCVRLLLELGRGTDSGRKDGGRLDAYGTGKVTVSRKENNDGRKEDGRYAPHGAIRSLASTTDVTSSWEENKSSAEKGRLQFTEVLCTALELGRMVEEDEISDFDAAKILLAQAPLSDTNKSFIASSSRVDRVDMSTTDGHGNTALHWAAFKNSVECTSVLLSHQANPNAIARTTGWTPLHDAAYSDSTETLQLLIQAGSNVNARANSGATPLCFAAQEDAPNATSALLNARADAAARCCDESQAKIGAGAAAPHHPSRFSGYTPLHYCAHYNALRAARVLLEYHDRMYEPPHRSLLEVPDLNDKLPIHVAVSRGSSEVLRALLHYGARVDTSRPRTCSMSVQNDDNSITSMSMASTIDYQQNHGDDGDGDIRRARSGSTDVQMMESDQSPSSPKSSAVLIVTPVSSPVLRSMIPPEPIESPKPWNCVSQRSIDECMMLIKEVEMNWAPHRHSIFHPRDRLAVIELLRVGKRLEQAGTRIFIDLWPLVLSFCGRGWFEPEDDNANVLSLHYQES